MAMDSEGPGMRAGDAARPRRIRVLVLEDSSTDAEIVIREVRRAGFDPDWKREETEAGFLNALEIPPDLILSDFAMPQFDGIRAVDLLRERGLDIPFILISGTVGEDLAASAIKHGADDYLLKDRLTRLGSAIAQAMTAKRLRDERQQAAEEARKIEKHYELISENTADVIWTFEVQSMKITWVSPSVQRMTGRTPAQVIAGRIEDFLAPDSVALVRAELQKALASFAGGDRNLLRAQTNEIEHRHRDGSLIAVEMVTTILTNEAGRPETVLGVSRDITERKRAEAARRLLATAIEQVAESIVITDTEGRIQYVNPAFTKINGHSFAEALGENPRILKSGRLTPDFYRQMWDTLVRGEVWSGRITNRRKEGSEYQAETMICPVRNTAGKTVNYVAVQRDVTELIALETQLRQAQKMEAIGTLAGGIAHDFNNLLQGLLSQIQALGKQRNNPERVGEVLTLLERNVNQGAYLTRQLLLFARRGESKKTRFDLNDAIKGTMEMLRHLVRENVAIIVDLTTEQLLVEGDHGEIEQILTNLVVNAADAMPDGGRLNVRTAFVAGRGALLIVSDNGHGIPAAIRERIFEPFFTTKTPEHGTGLGLSVVHGIVTKQGGRIAVESGVAGTAFTIELPLATGAGPETTARPAAETAVQEGAHERVLLVEDEDAARDGLREILIMLNYDVSAVATAEEAEVLSAQSPPFEILLTDVTLPGMPGNELAARLTNRWQDLRVILMSGYLEDASIHLAEGLHKMHFLQKPFTLDVLAAELQSVLGH